MANARGHFQFHRKQFRQNHDRNDLHAAADPGYLDDGSKRNKPQQHQNIYKAKTCAKEGPGQALVASGDQRPFYHRVDEDQQQRAIALCRFHALHKGVHELFTLQEAGLGEKAQPGDEAPPMGSAKWRNDSRTASKTTAANAAILPPTARTAASLGPT